MTGIEWTDETWNPVTGCTKVSQGCKFCYAETMHKRLMKMCPTKYDTPFSVVRCHESELSKPLKWAKPTMWFVNSMSDLFHKDVPISFIGKVFDVMNRCPWHIFQILTKRPHRELSLTPNMYVNDLCFNFSENIWLGTSIEDRNVLPDRLHALKLSDAKVKFLSLEPILEDLGELNLSGIDWVIVGGESGRTPRPIKAEWVRNIRDQCLDQNVPFFFKQWGGVNKKKAGRELDGREWLEMPKNYKLNHA